MCYPGESIENELQVSKIEGRKIRFVMIWGRDGRARIRVEAVRNRESEV